MTARITFACRCCGGSIVTDSMPEALAWDETHKDNCVALAGRQPLGDDVELVVAAVELLAARRSRFTTAGHIQRITRVGFVKAEILKAHLQSRGLIGALGVRRAQRHEVLFEPRNASTIIAALRAENPAAKVEQQCPSPDDSGDPCPKPLAGEGLMTITWADLKVGSVVRYQHLNRARRLAGQSLVIRRGRVERVIPPPQIRDGQTTITILNKDGSTNARLGQINLYGLDLIVSVEAANDDYHSAAIDDRQEGN